LLVGIIVYGNSRQIVAGQFKTNKRDPQQFNFLTIIITTTSHTDTMTGLELSQQHHSHHLQRQHLQKQQQQQCGNDDNDNGDNDDGEHIQHKESSCLSSTSLERLSPQQQQQKQEQQQQQGQQDLHNPPLCSEIQRLNDDTIRRISAEQAISDLASIVKELVDNALDAESSTIKSEYTVIDHHATTIVQCYKMDWTMFHLLLLTFIHSPAHVFFLSMQFSFVVNTYGVVRSLSHQSAYLDRDSTSSKSPMTDAGSHPRRGRTWPHGMPPPKFPRSMTYTPAQD
jgi:hypothetical protein